MFALIGLLLPRKQECPHLGSGRRQPVLPSTVFESSSIDFWGVSALNEWFAAFPPFCIEWAVACAKIVTAYRICSVRNRSGTLSRSSRMRSEEHTSELQSQFHLVCRLLLEKKKTK